MCLIKMWEKFFVQGDKQWGAKVLTVNNNTKSQEGVWVGKKTDPPGLVACNISLSKIIYALNLSFQKLSCVKHTKAEFYVIIIYYEYE